MNMSCKITWCQFHDTEDCDEHKGCGQFQPQFKHDFISNPVPVRYNRSTHMWEYDTDE